MRDDLSLHLGYPIPTLPTEGGPFPICGWYFTDRGRITPPTSVAPPPAVGKGRVDGHNPNYDWA